MRARAQRLWLPPSVKALCVCRFFTRVAGWGPGQLESECAAGVWFTAAASAGLVLDTGLDGAELWHKVRMPRVLGWAPAVQACASSRSAGAVRACQLSKP